MYSSPALVKTNDNGATVKIIMTVVQQSIDLCFGDTIDDANHNGALRIPQILLQCLEMLMEYLPAADPYAIEVGFIGVEMKASQGNMFRRGRIRKEIFV